MPLFMISFRHADAFRHDATSPVAFFHYAADVFATRLRLMLFLADAIYYAAAAFFDATPFFHYTAAVITLIVTITLNTCHY